MNKNELKNIKEEDWHFRDNQKRHSKNSNQGRHPCLVIKETEDHKSYINLGLTHSKKRGHHVNESIHDPRNWKQTSYIRDDIRIDPKASLNVILKELKLHPEDIKKIWKIINKKSSH